MTLEPISKREIACTIAKQLSGRAIEPSEISDHAVKRRGEKVRPLGEQAIRRRAAVLEVPDPVAHAEAHRRSLHIDSQAVEQPLEVGVVAVIEDDEPSVDLMGLVGGVDADRVRVPARVGICLEHSDVVRSVQQMGHDEARDTGTHHSDSHLSEHSASNWTCR